MFGISELKATVKRLTAELARKSKDSDTQYRKARRYQKLARIQSRKIKELEDFEEASKLLMELSWVNGSIGYRINLIESSPSPEALVYHYKALTNDFKKYHDTIASIIGLQVESFTDSYAFHGFIRDKEEDYKFLERYKEDFDKAEIIVKYHQAKSDYIRVTGE